jgi:hypothetical protein
MSEQAPAKKVNLKGASLFDYIKTTPLAAFGTLDFIMFSDFRCC